MQVRKEIVSHIGLDLGSHYVTDRCHIIVRGSIDDSEDQITDSAGKYQFKCKRGYVLGRRTRDPSDYQGEHQFADRCKSRAEKVAYHNGEVRLVIWQEFSKCAFLFH